MPISKAPRGARRREGLAREESVLQRDQRLLYGADQIAGERRGHHHAASAREQRVGEQLAQAAERVAERGLCQVQLTGGAGEVLLSVDGLEDDEQVQVDLAQAHAALL